MLLVIEFTLKFQKQPIKAVETIKNEEESKKSLPQIQKPVRSNDKLSLNRLIKYSIN